MVSIIDGTWIENVPPLLRYGKLLKSSVKNPMDEKGRAIGVVLLRFILPKRLKSLFDILGRLPGP